MKHIELKDIDFSSMTSESFERMLLATERLLEKGGYDKAIFVIGGGEPFVIFDTYADLVTKYKAKHGDRMNFTMLSNLTLLDDTKIEWMRKNRIGVQVSLDDLKSSKLLKTGEPTAPIVMKNIKALNEAGLGFSINTVFDDPQNDILPITDYICESLPNQWGLQSVFTISNEGKIDDLIAKFKQSISRLKENKFDIFNRFRFYNETLAKPGNYYLSSTYKFYIWPDLSAVYAGKLLGKFDEGVKEKVFNDENMLIAKPKARAGCADCPILQWCRGAVDYFYDTPEITSSICKIKREVLNFALKETQGYKPEPRSIKQMLTNCVIYDDAYFN